MCNGRDLLHSLDRTPRCCSAVTGWWHAAMAGTHEGRQCLRACSGCPNPNQPRGSQEMLELCSRKALSSPN